MGLSVRLLLTVWDLKLFHVHNMKWRHFLRLFKIDLEAIFMCVQDLSQLKVSEVNSKAVTFFSPKVSTI